MFKKISNIKNYQNIVEQVKSMIITGELKCGDKLPPERELASSFGVSRTSVREAIKALEVIGVVESRQGDGNFIVDNLDKSAYDNMSMLFSLYKGTTEQIIQLRCCMEIEAARYIINNCPDSEISHLKDIINNYNSAKNNETKILYDNKFHSMIISLSGNILFINIHYALSTLIKNNIQLSSTITEINYAPGELLKFHNDIMNAIIARDINATVTAVRSHYAFTDEDRKYFPKI